MAKNVMMAKQAESFSQSIQSGNGIHETWTISIQILMFFVHSIKHFEHSTAELKKLALELALIHTNAENTRN